MQRLIPRFGALILLPLLAVAAACASGGGAPTATPPVPTAASPVRPPASATATVASPAAPTATPYPTGIPAEEATAPPATDTPAPDASPTPGPAAGLTGPLADLAALPNVTMKFYDIAGSTADELRAQMSQLGPVDQFGSRNDAYTGWFVVWNWPKNPDGTCDLSQATVSAFITVTFPRWTAPPGAPPALAQRWQQYVDALATHEEGHADFVDQSIPDILGALKGAACDTAGAAGLAVLDRIRQHDLDYDNATGHGATQGAVFP